MSRTLARSVNIHDPETGEFHVYEAGETVSSEVADLITNPWAWKDPDNVTPEGDSDIQVTAMSQEDAQAGADATATNPKGKSRGGATPNTEQPEDDYESMRVPDLVSLAQDRGVDLQGSTKKEDVIDRLREADASQR
jgi:hypothetical protein